MKNFLSILMIGLIFTSCERGIEGSGNVQKQDRQVADFDEIEVSGSFNVIISQGETPSVAVEADENLLAEITTEVSGDELRIKSKRKIADYRQLNVYVTVRKIERIEASGACVIESSDELRSENLKIELSGASEANLALRCDELQLDLSGACELNLRGAAEEMELDASGSCTLHAFELRTAKTEIDMSGAGKADIYVSDDLKVDVSGAAEIRYKGNPQDIEQNSSGAASISAYN